MNGTFLDDIWIHAARRPAAPAVLTPAGSLSYRELTERIERLAGVLRDHGLGPERLSAIALDRNLDVLIATAAVVRTGGAFLTLDTELPLLRLAGMVRDSRADLLVTTTAVAERLRLPIRGPRVLLDDPEPGRLGSIADSQVATHPHALAYLSFTSGSTGTPNVVLIEQGGLRSYLRCLVRDCRLGPATVALQVAPLGYDASIRDMFAPLIAGGRLVLVPRTRLLGPGGFAETIRAFGVNAVLSVTPSLLGFLLQHSDSAEQLRGLSLVVTSGESLQPFLASGGRGALGGVLVNQYGPTECTMTSTRYQVPAEPEPDDVVGSPSDGVTVRLLDADLCPVQDGFVGEIYIGGPGVARGYLGRPAMTADRFRPDPLGERGARSYRTGDLGRRRSDGALVYLGRTDRQIKIRGYRVDPAEIEGRLLTHPLVTGAAVTTEQDARGRTALIAYVTGSLAEVADTALREQLAEVLPFYMMPRRFVRIERLPLTHSGKVDRARLAARRPAAGDETKLPSPQREPIPVRTP